MTKRTEPNQTGRVLAVLEGAGEHPMTEFWALRPTIVHIPRRLANLRECCPCCKGAKLLAVRPLPEGLKEQWRCPNCGSLMSKRVAQAHPLIEAWRWEPRREERRLASAPNAGQAPSETSSGPGQPPQAPVLPPSASPVVARPLGGTKPQANSEQALRDAPGPAIPRRRGYGGPVSGNARPAQPAIREGLFR